ncbi:MAG TPA: primosomal protein N' [Gammaproteobacteria bacterium]
MEILRLVRVAVPVPLADTFDYLWMDGTPPPAPGVRVRVPFGRRERIGIVVGHPDRTDLPPAKLKPVRAVLDAEPLLSGELLDTLAWAAGYYHHPIGEVLSHALPGLLRKREAAREEAAFRLTPEGRRQAPEALGARAPQQAIALAALGAAEALTTEALKGAGIGADALRRLAAKGWIERVRPTACAPAPAEPPVPPPELTAEQRAVVESIAAAPRGFGCWLLHGVTGSGKTEVYMRLIARELEAGRQTLLLVPEIGLTPQLVARLRQRFGAELAVTHSGLTERQRFEAWQAARSGAAKLVVGTRSAVFVPLPNAGLVIVDEEHDPSFKQQTGFRYSARDLAVLRARRLGIPVLLASATPSLESMHNARVGRYRLLKMPTRIGSAGPPRIEVIDLGKHASRRALSTPLVARIERHLRAGNQVMLFLNRRGFAPALFCTECHTTEDCPRCDARLTVHARAGRLRCHHCGDERPLEWRCARCGSERIAVGAGTQRVDEELRALFPDARVARLDRDAVAGKGTLAAVLDDVASGTTQILVGTQMLTKGHDLPRVTLVGVLNADQGLFGTDFRSHERLAQTLLQVAGRAGRADLPGEVIVQTHYPRHPLLQCLVRQDYEAFAELALAERRQAAWPPFAHVAAWRAEAPVRGAAFAFLERVRAAAGDSPPGVRVLGPAPAAMERKDGRFRAQLLFVAAERRPLHELLDRTLAVARGLAEGRKARWSVDVDPVEI